VTALRAVGARTFTSLRIHRNYRLFFSGQIISLVGTWMQNTALAWLVVDLTHSPVAVGFLAFCRFVPFSVFGLVAGVVADRFDNRRLVMTTQAFQMAAASGLNELGGAGRSSSAMGGMSAAGRRGMGASGKRVNAFTLCARVGNLASGSKPIASCTKPAKTERRTLFQGPKSPENTPITSTG